MRRKGGKEVRRTGKGRRLLHNSDDKNSFHGRTLTTLAATGQEHYHELYRPLTPGFVSVNAEKPEELKELAGRIENRRRAF